jgi:hypothetical protein
MKPVFSKLSLMAKIADSLIRISVDVGRLKHCVSIRVAVFN